MTAVSVIIPTFNRAQKVVRAVLSVLHQTFTDFELIVIDDGSTDATLQALAQYKDRLFLISHSNNRGVSAARNTGIRNSSAPLIAFLDSDDYWLPEKLAAQVDFFVARPEALACQTEEVWIRKGRRVNPGKRHLKPSGNIFEPSLRLCLVSPSAVMLKRILIAEVGLFDERLPACEDYDLWLRIACRHPVYLIPDPLVIKEGGCPDQLSLRYKGMDRFRIRALCKVIESGALSQGQLETALQALAAKCRIYSTGCLKRGKRKEGDLYRNLPERIKERIQQGI